MKKNGLIESKSLLNNAPSSWVRYPKENIYAVTKNLISGSTKNYKRLHASLSKNYWLLLCKKRKKIKSKKKNSPVENSRRSNISMGSEK